MKNQKNEFNLLHGTFNAAYTKEILQRLFNDKIMFHSLRNFSHEERFGKPDPHAQARIPELRRTLEEILNYIQMHKSDGRFEIHADIQINPVQS